jgi:hypothetical protein
MPLVFVDETTKIKIPGKAGKSLNDNPKDEK